MANKLSLHVRPEARQRLAVDTSKSSTKTRSRARPAVCSQLPETAAKSTSAAVQLERAMKHVGRLVPLQRDYEIMSETYRKSENNFWAPASPRIALEAADRAREALFKMQRVADHIVREYQPVLAERRHDTETLRQVALVHAASAASQQHGWRLKILALELSFMLPRAEHV